MSPKAELKALEVVCDKFLVECCRLLRPEILVGIGKFAGERAKVALLKSGILGDDDRFLKDIRVESILHPSPRNPKANREPGWEAIALEQLSNIGILKYITEEPPADILKRLMKNHGGKYYAYPSQDVTHVVVSSLAYTKIKKIGKNDKFVTAKWITDSYTLNLEAVSCDEMFADLSELCQETGAKPLEVAAVIREEIFQKSQCPASAGLGPTMLVARLATKKAKPNGQFYVPKSDVAGFMKDIKVGDLPGVGYRTVEKLSELGVKNCADLQAVSLQVLCKEFGPKHGKQLLENASGEDRRLIKEDVVRKSVSCDVNYGIRFTEESETQAFIQRLSEEVAERLKKASMAGRSVTLKLLVRNAEAPVNPRKFMGCGICDCFTKSTTLPVATADKSVISRECLSLLRQIHPNIADLRGVGISMHRLEVIGRKNPKEEGESSAGGGIVKFLRTKSVEKLQPIANEQEHKNAQVLVGSSDTGRKVMDAGFRMSIFDRSTNPILLPEKEMLDTEVLNELPESMREEVLEAYRKKERLKQKPKQSPVKKRKKRPPTVRSSSPVKHTCTLSQIWCKTTEENDDETGVTAIESVNSGPDSTPVWDGEECKLFGNRSYNSVKAALREKICQEQDISAEDFSAVGRYLQTIITREHKLASAECLLRVLHRFISRKDDLNWKHHYEKILNLCQNATVSEYGCQMRNMPSFNLT